MTQNKDKNEQVIACLTLVGYESKIILHTYEDLKEIIQKARLLVLDSGFVSARATKDAISRKACLDSLSKNTSVVIMPPGEGVKNRTNFSLLLETLFKYNLTRKDSILIIGGGALCDMASYVASVYLRGIKIVLVPSTLLSMIDASIGGKTAINFGVLKNMVGSFYPAEEIVIVPSIISTLSAKLLKEGYAELLKAGLLRNENIVNTIEAHPQLWNEAFDTNKTLWEELITQAIKVKTEVVQKDFKEENIRAHLNLGHTFAHAHEATARAKGMNISHGEAVGLGIRAAMQLGLRLDITQKDYARRVISILENIGYPSHYDGLESKLMLEYMKKDKKRIGKEIRLILQKKINDTHILSVDENEIREVLIQLGAK